jgi:hypothetical protein
LVDPKTTRAPIETKFELREEGIHCGYEHGTSVWIKYIEPAPEFSAVPWRAEISYAKDEVVYVPNTGECYRSLTNNNRGHDPNLFSVASRRLLHEITQESIPDAPGREEQPEILRVYFGLSEPGGNPPDPPPNLSQFGIEIVDADGVTLASTSDAGDGVKTISQIMYTIRTALLTALGGGWTITNNGTNKTMDIENASVFTTLNTVTVYVDPPPDNLKVHFLKVVQIQPYVPSFSAASGQSQEMTLTFTDADVVPGATYSLEFRGDDGEAHTITYLSLETDASVDIIQGLLDAINAAVATDVFFERISATTSLSTVTFSTRRTVSLEPTMQRPGTPYWAVVPFPEALMEPVVRGASATLLGEWGQSDKQGTEEGKVPWETDVSRGDFVTTPVAPLTTQQKPMSRYKL